MPTPSSILALTNQLNNYSPAQAQAVFVNLDIPTQNAILGLLPASSPVRSALMYVQSVVAKQGLAIAQSIFSGAVSAAAVAAATPNASATTLATTTTSTPATPVTPAIPTSATNAYIQPLPNSVSLGITATGSTQAAALPLVSSWNQVTSGSTAGVCLSTAPGTAQIVVNLTGGNINVYPPVGLPSLTWAQLTMTWSADYLTWSTASGGSINQLAANTAYTLSNGGVVSFLAFSPTQFYSK